MAEKLKELLGLLEERLVEHDESRKEVQEKLKGTCSSITKDADLLEEKISGEISKDFEEKEEEILGLIEKLNEGGSDIDALIKKAKEELTKEWEYEIQHYDSGESFVDLYELKVSSVKVKKEFIFNDTEFIIKALQEHLSKLHDCMTASHEKLDEICNERKKDTEELYMRINGKLEDLFKAEDARIQSVVKVVKESICDRNHEEFDELTRKAKLTLLKKQKYSLIEEEGDSLDNYDLKVKKEASLEVIEFEERKLTNVIPSFTKKGELSLSFTFFDEDEEEVLKDVDSPFEVEVNVWEKGHEKDTSKTFTKDFTFGSDELVSFMSTFAASTPYCLKVKITSKRMSTQWSDEAEFTTPEFKDLCVWKECPDDVNENMQYFVGEKNPRIATKIEYGWSTIIGNTPLPLNKVASWSIKILELCNNDGSYIFIGVAPSDINQNGNGNSKECGWYFDSFESMLDSGPPHNYEDREYGLRKEQGQYIHTGDSVGVVMDTANGDLSFVLNGINLSVAYKGIPLDKPLVPCVILGKYGDFVEVDPYEVKEIVDGYINVSNITTKSITWDSITLTWDPVEGASFYQIDVDGSRSWETITKRTFAKRGFFPGTEHTFMVRAVRGNSVSKWSGAVEGVTQKAPEFSECVWKECPEDVHEKRKYYVDENNPRIATKVDNGWCTVMGNAPLLLSQVTSWSIKILKSRDDDGGGIFIGIAPFDINQNSDDNSYKCGWYFKCYGSTLWSGPPHNYNGKEYGPRKNNGEYIHTGDSVGVVMDTAKGELSFVVNGVNLGVAYEGIPLDKPLVSCAILKYQGDSVELDTSEAKENMDSSINISNITTTSITWGSITLTWDAVEGASFYQIEVDESKFWDASTTNSFTKRGLLPETEYTFRVRVVRRNSVSEWSDIVKGKTQKALCFSECDWKECPPELNNDLKYSLGEKSPRIATKNERGNGWGNEFCTVIGNTPLPLNKVTSWCIKILKSLDDNGNCICVGVAPFNVNQNEDDNFEKCGWYFDCYESTLYSGPPHYYWRKEYGPRKKYGQYVHTGDSVGVVMDTAKGELSFALNGVNLGVAYEGIPLDKPLVSCVILRFESDSVELII